MCPPHNVLFGCKSQLLTMNIIMTAAFTCRLSNLPSRSDLRSPLYGSTYIIYSCIIATIITAYHVRSRPRIRMYSLLVICAYSQCDPTPLKQGVSWMFWLQCLLILLSVIPRAVSCIINYLHIVIVSVYSCSIS